MAADVALEGSPASRGGGGGSLLFKTKHADTSEGGLLIGAGVIWSYLMRRSHWLTGNSSRRFSTTRLSWLSSLAMGAGLDLEGRRRGNCYMVYEDGRR